MSPGDDPFLRLAEEALEAGAAVLRGGSSGLDAAEAAVCVLEDCPLVNAGRGSAFTADEKHEMGACIMDDRGRLAGAVLGLGTTRYAVKGARAVMDRSPHVALYGCDAWLDQQGLEQQDPSWFDTPQSRERLEEAREKEARERKGDRSMRTGRQGEDQEEGSSEGQAQAKEEAPAGESSGDAEWGSAAGSVGAVVLDSEGHLVAASSSGGRDNKWTGALSGAACPGAGTYACPACAVSCSDIGEEPLRHAAASTVGQMVLLGFPLARACESVGRDQMRPRGGGMIAVDLHGTVVTAFTSGAIVYGVAREGEATTTARVAVAGGRATTTPPPAAPPPPPALPPPPVTSPRGSLASVDGSGRDIPSWPPCQPI
jgi:beta-aspartyl-peptidase (threonine type)